MAERIEKCYKNPFDDNFTKYDTVTTSGQLHPDFEENIRSVCKSMLKKLNSSFNEKDCDDYSIYTGSSGIALLYLLVANKLKKPEYLERARRVLDACVGRARGRRLGFLNGDAGPMAAAAVTAHMQGRHADAAQLARRVEALVPAAVAAGEQMPDEVLYGRAGLLFALLFLQRHVGEGAVDDAAIRQLVAAILKSGRELSAREKRRVPLMYMWHEKYYLGAAHGIAGILYMLLQARRHLSKAELQEQVRPSVDFLQATAFPSGNFPSSLGNKSDRLVQWCHGAPGMVDLFLLAHKVFGDEAYLLTAQRCGDLVWESGILRKSYGVCHGVAGNAYVFLSLYNHTKEVQNLHRACKFAEWCTSYGKHQNRTPDRPLSLFEGIAGAIYFMVDILDPKTALFPAYAL